VKGEEKLRTCAHERDSAHYVRARARENATGLMSCRESTQARENEKTRQRARESERARERESERAREHDEIVGTKTRGEKDRVGKKE